VPLTFEPITALSTLSPSPLADRGSR
jgi:hypothetical protein